MTLDTSKAAAALAKASTAISEGVAAVNDLQAQHGQQADAWSTERAQLLTKIEQLEHPTTPPTPTRRFPGDPGPGRIMLGVATRGGNVARLDEHEKAAGKRLYHRIYFNDGISDMRRDGPGGKAIRAYHARGQLVAPSFKIGVAEAAAGKYDAQLQDWHGWLEQQLFDTQEMVHHEPENDQKGSAQYAADFRGCQHAVRNSIQLAVAKPTKVAFGGSLMAYTWTQTAARDGIVGPESWFPGPGVWDWCGIDQYAQKAGTPILDQKWKDAVATIKRWNVPLAITELGIRSEDPEAAAKLRGVYEAAIAAGAVHFWPYDNDANSTGTGWILTGPQLAMFRQLIADPRTANPAVLATTA